jgi:PAS domain S-box-containing protein
MVIFSLLLEKVEDDYYYRYISDNVTYYIPSYKTDRLNKPISEFESFEDYTSISEFLNKVYDENEYSEDYVVKEAKDTKEISITIMGYKYKNFIVLIGSQKSDILLEETLFKEDYIFLVRWIGNKEDLIDDISDNVVNLLGYSKQEILSKPYIDFIHPDDIDLFNQELNEHIKENTASFYQRYRLLAKSGKAITILDHSCQIFKGNTKTIIGYLRDITVETQISTQLKELINLDEEDFNSSILIKIEWDLEYRIVRWNTEAQDLIGWGSEILGKSIRELNLFSDADSIKMQGQFKRLFAKEVDSVISSFRIQKKEGGFIDTKWSNRLITREGKLRVVSSVIDKSQETLLTTRLDEMEGRSDLLLKTLENTHLSNDVFTKLMHNPLTGNPEGLIKAEIIIRKLEEEITRLNNTIFYNNDNNLMSDVAFLKSGERTLKDKLAKVEENNKKLEEQLDNLLNVNILTLFKGLDFKKVIAIIMSGYLLFGQLIPALYPVVIKPLYQQYNREMKEIDEGKK